jgi:tripartite-type tricarboxylate transporter receptor subunit TctC
MSKVKRDDVGRRKTRHRRGTLALTVTALLISQAVHAQAPAYPVKPIRIVVPLAPGGGNDTLARFIAKPLSESLGQQLVVENRPGGGGLVGGEYVARSRPTATHWW